MSVQMDRLPEGARVASETPVSARRRSPKRAAGARARLRCMKPGCEALDPFVGEAAAYRHLDEEHDGQGRLECVVDRRGR